MSLSWPMAVWPSFELQVGNDRERLALPQRSPYPLMQPCTCVAPASTAARVLATATSESLWVWMPRMPSNRLRTSATISVSRPVSVPPLVSHRQSTLAPASRAASRVRSAKAGLPIIAVEEVLGVVHHFFAVSPQVGYGLGNQLQVFLFGDAERAGGVQVPALAEDRDHGRTGGDQRLHVAIFFHGMTGEAGGAERGELRVLEVQFGWGAGEEVLVLGIRARPAAFDVVDAQARRAFAR